MIDQYLPESFQELSSVIGITPALAIVALRGGECLSVPKKVNPEHWLIGAIGREPFKKLVEYYNGEEIPVPRCDHAIRVTREMEILKKWKEGKSTQELARMYGYTDRGIRKLLRRSEQRDKTI